MRRKSYTELSGSVRDLVTAGSVFKSSVFRSTLKNEDVSDRTIRDYLSTMTNFVGEWSDYCDDIDDAIKGVKDVKWARISCDHDDVEKYLYARYDYASVLMFASSVFDNIEADKFKDDDDVEDFFDSMTERSFHRRSESTAGLMEDVADLEDPGNDRKASAADIAKFKSVKNQHPLFNRRDSKELYKSIERVCQEMQTRLNADPEFLKRSPKIMIACVNYLVEYMAYSAVAFATRAYAVGTYVYPFVASSSNGSGEKEMTESVEQQDSLATGISQTASDDMFRDIAKYKDTQKFMDEWLRKLGHNVRENNVYFMFAKEDNEFAKATLSNPLVEYLDRKFAATLSAYKYDLPTLEEMRDCYKKFTINSTQAIQGTTTPKQEIMIAIKTTKPETKTVESYSQLASDLIDYVMPMLRQLSLGYEKIQEWRIGEANYPQSTTTVLKISNEILTLIADLYRELSTAMLTRARDIEMTIASIKNETARKKMEELTIKVPNVKKDDLSSNDNTMMGVPDTTRTPLNIDALYALPKMESLEMYDEYVQTLPGMAGDPYYEAGIGSTILNAISAFFQSMAKRIEQFFNNAQFSQAVKWCQNHQAQLQQMNFNGSTMEVLPYQKDVNIGFLVSMALNLGKFNDEVLKSKESVDAFIASLYGNGNQKLINNFNNPDLKPDEQSQRLQNWILFGKELDDTSPIQNRKLNDSNAIKNELMTIWMDNVINSKKTHQDLVDTIKNLTTVVNNMKTKIANNAAANQANNQNNTQQQNPPGTQQGSQQGTQQNANGTQQNNTGAPQPASQNQQNTQQNANAQNNGGPMNSTDLTTDLLNRTQTAVNQLLNGSYHAVTSAIKTQYHYIQQAWSIGSKNAR